MKVYILLTLTVVVAIAAHDQPSFLIKCVRPICGAEEVNKKWPVEEDPHHYYECVPSKDGYESVVRPCPDNLWFDFRLQACCDENQWEDVCDDGSSGECGCTGEEETTIDDTSEETDEPCGGCTTDDTSEETDEPCENCTCTEEEETTTEPPPPPLPKNPECGRPKCDCEENAEILWPGKTPYTFYRCIPCGPNDWAAQLNKCEDPIMTHFSYSKQGCVRSTDWVSECRKASIFEWMFA